MVIIFKNRSFPVCVLLGGFGGMPQEDLDFGVL